MNKKSSSLVPFGEVRVRLLEISEKDRFDQLLEQQHYLKSARIGGRSLRYVAELNGDWIAIASFSVAAPHIKAREEWIGWNRTQRARRLLFVVNNSRFLMLTHSHEYPNMASKVLSLCLKKLPDDWEHRWGHPYIVSGKFCG